MLKAIKKIIRKNKKKSPRKMRDEEFSALRSEITNDAPTVIDIVFVAIVFLRVWKERFGL